KPEYTQSLLLYSGELFSSRCGGYGYSTPLGVRIMPACSHENPRGSGHSSGAQPVGSSALPYGMSPTRALSLESANARGTARDAAMAMASDATCILRMDFCCSLAPRWRYLWNLEPDGLLEPWMLVWHARQARPISRSSGAGPVASPAVVSTSLGCPVMVWHCWHNIGTGSVSNACWLEPCGSWQARQFSRTGACSNRNGPRFSAWQA